MSPSAILRSAAAPATTTDGAEHKPILAERFKTKVCQNFVKTGACPYEARCMFAHGDADLRTKEMNLEDGLTTEDAIKAFQRARWAAERAAAEAATKKSKSAAKKAAKAQVAMLSPSKINHAAPTAVTPNKQPPAVAAPTPSAVTPATSKAAKIEQALKTVCAKTPIAEVAVPSAPATPARTPDTVAALNSPRAASSDATPTPKQAPGTSATPQLRYRHNPYAPVQLMWMEPSIEYLYSSSDYHQSYEQTHCGYDEASYYHHRRHGQVLLA